MCKQVQAPLACTYLSLAHTGTAAACRGHTAAPCAASLSGQLDPAVLALARSQVAVGGAGKWCSHPAGKALACSNGVCAPFVLIAPLDPAAFRGCSDGVGGPVCFLSPSAVPSPQPWGSAQHRGTLEQTVAKPAHCRHLPHSTCFRAQPSSHGWAEPFLWVTKCQPRAQGSPGRAPSSPLPMVPYGLTSCIPGTPDLASPGPQCLPPQLAQLGGSMEERAGGCVLLQRVGSPAGDA